MAITGRSYPNHPTVLKAEGVQVVGTQAIVVSAPTARRFYVYNKGTRANALPGIVTGSPVTVLARSSRPDGRYLRVNPTLIAQGSATSTPDVSPYTVIVASQPVDRRLSAVNHPRVTFDTLGEQVTGTQAQVYDAPTDRKFLRVNPAITRAADGEQVAGTQALVVTGPRRKVLAPQPIILTPLVQAPVTPGSPPSTLVVLPAPYPHRTTRPPILLSSAVGVPPLPPSTPDPDFCAGAPFTSWAAFIPFTDWDADGPTTNWRALDPKGDCP